MKHLDHAEPSWGSIIKRFRIDACLTQTALADLLHVDHTTISRRERGRDKPELGMQRRLRALIEPQVPHCQNRPSSWPIPALSVEVPHRENTKGAIPSGQRAMPIAAFEAFVQVLTDECTVGFPTVGARSRYITAWSALRNAMANIGYAEACHAKG
jgi:DNA-binding XRE family transcriptional regulator